MPEPVDASPVDAEPEPLGLEVVPEAPADEPLEAPGAVDVSPVPYEPWPAGVETEPLAPAPPAPAAAPARALAVSPVWSLRAVFPDSELV